MLFSLRRFFRNHSNCFDWICLSEKYSCLLKGLRKVIRLDFETSGAKNH